MKDKKYFFGWENIKWFFIELIKTFSNQPSFFASKRIERSFLFTTALVLTIIYFSYHVKTMQSTDMLLIVGMLFAYAGYTTNIMRKEKLDEKAIHKNE